MAITIERKGQRVYLIGDTFAVKDRIKSMGEHWDGDRRAWWVGQAKETQARELAEQLSTSGATTSQKRPQVGDDSCVVAKAKYKGRTYYVLWLGTTKSGAKKARLTVLNGSIDFWVDTAACEILKTYTPCEYRGRTEYTTLGSIRRFVERIKQDEANGDASPLKYPRTGCSCGSRDGIIQDTDCFTCRLDAE